MTGMDDGWKADYLYWTTEGGLCIGKNYWNKVLFIGEVPVAIISFALDIENEAEIHIMDILVRQDLRGRGYGSKAITELLQKGAEIFGHNILSATVVIFPNNTASQKAFERAGFAFDHAHPDGDAWYYLYRSENM